MLRALFAIVGVLPAFCFAQTPRATASAQPNRIPDITLPSTFPSGKYTPHGYIDNPYHSMVFNRSGVIRSLPPLGFGWWRADFKGAYGNGVRDHVNYFSLLQLSLAVDGIVFVGQDDFDRRGVELYSAYHTKNLMSYDWSYQSLEVSLRYSLSRENSLVCIVELKNTGAAPKDIIVHATNICNIGDIKWWGSNGITSKYVREANAAVSKIWAYGDVFALGSSMTNTSHKVTASAQQWATWIGGNDSTSTVDTFVVGRGPLWSVQSYKLTVAPNSKNAFLLCLSRGKNERQAIEEFGTAQRDAMDDVRKLLEEDHTFWSRCPVLGGDWPDSWKRGWVYDFETLRMNVRRPIGIFRHPWDGMQVHSPRMVLGETSLDMMTLSYADPKLAQQVLYGTFADALAPNVPCAREDGSVNMISSDGSECGTAPMWGFPFHVIKSIYLSTYDTQWIANLYPHIKAYVTWWLDHRTDKQGWLHCNNSWESGQDGSRRFIVAEENEGAVASFVRTVDTEASMAEAMNILAFFAPIAGRAHEQSSWLRLAERRIANTRAMFVDGWFRDVDGRTETPIILKDYYDVMMLSPLTCGVATEMQVNAVKPRLTYFLGKEGRRLQWPPGLFTFTEAAWNADMRNAASEAVAMTAQRVYRRTDARQVAFADNHFSYRIPGVANEFWPARDTLAGGENYGWGATLPMLIIRNIIGFRESASNEFSLAPALPKLVTQSKKKVGITNLHYRGSTLNITYETGISETVTVGLELWSPSDVILNVVSNGKSISTRNEKKKHHLLTFAGTNGDVFAISLR